VANAPKAIRPQAPSDIGDQYLKMSAGPATPVSISMCQKRSGWPRSMVSSSGHTIVSGSASRKDSRAACSSSGRPHSRSIVPSV
jgi:hypothetical protein